MSRRNLPSRIGFVTKQAFSGIELVISHRVLITNILFHSRARLQSQVVHYSDDRTKLSIFEVKSHAVRTLLFYLLHCLHRRDTMIAVRSAGIVRPCSIRIPVILSYPRLQRSAASISDKPSSESKTTPKLIYEGPMTTVFTRLKIFSITSLGVTALIAPFMLLLDGGSSSATAASMTPAVKGVIVSIAMGTSSLSTFLIHWFAKTYVTKIYRKDTGLTFETLNVIAKPLYTGPISPSMLSRDTNRSFAKYELKDPAGVTSWNSAGRRKRTLQHFYVHEEILPPEIQGAIGDRNAL